MRDKKAYDRAWRKRNMTMREYYYWLDSREMEGRPATPEECKVFISTKHGWSVYYQYMQKVRAACCVQPTPEASPTRPTRYTESEKEYRARLKEAKRCNAYCEPRKHVKRASDPLIIDYYHYYMGLLCEGYMPDELKERTKIYLTNVNARAML